jgi:outer membrane protein
MKKINFFFILIVLCFLPTHYIFADDKIAFIDIDLILSKSVASIDLFDQLKKNEEIKLNELKKEEKKLKEIENKILSKKNII